MGNRITQHQKVIRGLQTSWLQTGDNHKPIMLFLHGYPDAAETWDAQLEYFKSQYQVIAPYVRGAQPSAKANQLSRYGLRSIALDQLSILKQVDPDMARPITLVGHDLGAAQAWYLAPLLGKRLRALIILNGLSTKQMLARLSKPAQHAKSWYIYVMQLPKVPELILRRFPGKILQFAYQQGGLSHERRPELRSVLGSVVNPANQYRAYVRETFREPQSSHKRLLCPVLVLWGKDDRFLLPPEKREFTRDAKNVTIRILRGNHWLHREHPDAVNQLIEEFSANASLTNT